MTRNGGSSAVGLNSLLRVTHPLPKGVSPVRLWHPLALKQPCPRIGAPPLGDLRLFTRDVELDRVRSENRRNRGHRGWGVGRIVRPRKAKSDMPKIGYPPPFFGRGVGHLWLRGVEGGVTRNAGSFLTYNSTALAEGHAPADRPPGSHRSRWPTPLRRGPLSGRARLVPLGHDGGDGAQRGDPFYSPAATSTVTSTSSRCLRSSTVKAALRRGHKAASTA